MTQRLGRRRLTAGLTALLAGGVLLLPACGGGGGTGAATPAILASPTAIPPLRIVTPTPGGSGSGAPPATQAAPTQAGPAPTHAATSAPTQVAAPAGHYVVQTGDTLYGIAARFNVSLDALMQANGISDPSVIRVGQELVIPAHKP